MKTCPYCAEQVQDAAVVCRFCNRDLTAAASPGAVRPPAGQPVSSPNTATTTTRNRRVAFAAVASALVVLGVIGATAEDSTPEYAASQSGGPAAPPPPRVVTVADKEDLVVPAEELKGWSWAVTESQPNCRLTGHLEVLEGGNRDVVVYVTTEDEYKNLSNGHKAMVKFQTDKVTAVTLDVPTREAGKYVLTISNTFSALTPKRVRAEDIKVTCQ